MGKAFLIADWVHPKINLQSDIRNLQSKKTPIPKNERFEDFDTGASG